ncbi:hypothetical protein ELUMI_v1c03750 [Williamsoniiplasma luminosum]|uniref:Uncharacterized protein n=1 Tax=Williamsoniiplasma luminosum TaxID=214888 RepID=A0A2K8NTD7_9MOLU|nr:hypothetical protein [Williamsoniiplasma luminosum]ATZ17100.1 hypothetical protein ELUMI_v1c03750 [Williamsoniiplasma luminosum]
MKKINSFFPNMHLMIAHYKNNWKIILIFGIIFVGLSTIMFLSPILSSITDRNIVIVATGKEHQTSILGTLNWFNLYRILFFSLLSFSLTRNMIGQEIRSGQINLWMTAPISRNRIMFSKICFLWSVTLIILIPSLLPFLITSAVAVDANQHFGRLVLQLLGIILFTLMFTTIYILVTVIFSSLDRVTGLINSGIFLYLSIFQILKTLVGLELGGYIQYFNLNSLLVAVIKPDGAYTNLGWVIGSMGINVAVISVLAYLSCWNFKRKEFML